jgi:hypothetical protein
MDPAPEHTDPDPAPEHTNPDPAPEHTDPDPAPVPHHCYSSSIFEYFNNNFFSFQTYKKNLFPIWIQIRIQQKAWNTSKYKNPDPKDWQYPVTCCWWRPGPVPCQRGKQTAVSGSLRPQYPSPEIHPFISL